MAQNFFFSPVEIGRIATGYASVDAEGKATPVAQDHFTITTNTRSGTVFEKHDIQDQLQPDPAKTLKSIPVRIMFDTVDNNLQVSYSAFNQSGHCVCSSRDEGVAYRRNGAAYEKFPCASPISCEFAHQIKSNGGECKRYARLLVSIEPGITKDPYSAFVLRTASDNTVRSLMSRLTQMHALSGGKIAGAPMNLVMREKTYTSFGKNFFYVDLEPQTTLFEAIAASRLHHKNLEDMGLDIPALELSVAKGIRMGYAPESKEDEADTGRQFFGSQSKAQDKPLQNNGHQSDVSYDGLGEILIDDAASEEDSLEYQTVIKEIDLALGKNTSRAHLEACLLNKRELSQSQKEKAIQYLDSKIQTLADTVVQS